MFDNWLLLVPYQLEHHIIFNQTRSMNFVVSIVMKARTSLSKINKFSSIHSTLVKTKKNENLRDSNLNLGNWTLQLAMKQLRFVEIHAHASVCMCLSQDHTHAHNIQFGF